MPFKKNLFDRIFCFGVLQHVPYVEDAFNSLVKYLKSGGSIVIDVYSESTWLLWRVKYKLRPFIKRIPHKLLYAILKLLIPVGLKIKIKLSEGNSVMGRTIGEAIPILNYKGVYPLSDKQLLDWAILDTFDMFASRYDQPQNIEDVKKWFDKANLSDVEVDFGFNGIYGRATKR